MRSLISVFALLVGLLFILPAAAEACSCYGPRPPCEAFWNAPVVFSGEVEHVETIVPERTMPDGTRVYGPIKRKVRISVTEAFRGVPGREKVLEINTGGGGGDCGYDFQKGQKYVVYAYQNAQTGALSTSICTRTRPLEKASEDLEYFKSLADAKPGSKIYGSIYQVVPRRNDAPFIKPQPLAGITVGVQGAPGKFETKTGADGGFEFADLVAGEYRLAVKPPGHLWGYEEAKTLTVFDKGCSAYSFALEAKTFLGGRLLDENGAPAADMGVNLVPVEQVNNSRHPDAEYAHTDKEGKFIFRSLPAGKYYLGVRLTGPSDFLFPYPQTFYPGTTDLAEARIINVEEGKTLENLDFRLPPKLPTRKVQGKVVFPDGTPAPGASLSVNETEYFYSFSFRGAGNTKADGTFSFEVVDGIRFLVKPYVNLKGGSQRHAEPVELPAKGGVKGLKFVLTEPMGNCSKCLNWARNRR